MRTVQGDCCSIAHGDGMKKGDSLRTLLVIASSSNYSISPHHKFSRIQGNLGVTSGVKEAGWR